jgi:hypothetical protein
MAHPTNTAIGIVMVMVTYLTGVGMTIMCSDRVMTVKYSDVLAWLSPKALALAWPLGGSWPLKIPGQAKAMIQGLALA